MKVAERVVMVLLLVCFLGGAWWLYSTVQAERQDIRDAVARGEYERPVEPEDEVVRESDWQDIYGATVALMIGSTSVQASVADSLPERIKGLSNTPYLPEGVVKLFVFGAAGEHAIWMKDMNYALDIIWVAKEGEIVHIEEHVAPDTFPDSFASPVPAWYVIEANAGFVESNTIAIGDQVVLPSQ